MIFRLFRSMNTHYKCAFQPTQCIDYALCHHPIGHCRRTAVSLPGQGAPKRAITACSPIPKARQDRRGSSEACRPPSAAPASRRDLMQGMALAADERHESKAALAEQRATFPQFLPGIDLALADAVRHFPAVDDEAARIEAGCSLAAERLV